MKFFLKVGSANECWLLWKHSEYGHKFYLDRPVPVGCRGRQIQEMVHS